MALKPRTPKKTQATDQQIEALANKLADKPYDQAAPVKEEKTMRSITLTQSLDDAIQRAAAENKINRSGPTNASALIRQAIEDYLERRG
ncbi:hypothetical protein ID007_004314 [Salmonella enterica]|nr:hypothetical protein [Salmonella enterica]